jgi:hypothetical protein
VYVELAKGKRGNFVAVRFCQGIITQALPAERVVNTTLEQANIHTEKTFIQTLELRVACILNGVMGAKKGVRYFTPKLKKREPLIIPKNHKPGHASREIECLTFNLLDYPLTS